MPRAKRPEPATTPTVAEPTPAPKPARTRKRAAKAEPVAEVMVMPEAATVEPDEFQPSAAPDLPVVYEVLDIVECSVTSEAGPLTVERIKLMMNWETEREYQARKVVEDPDSKPEHWLFGDDYHCLNTDKQKVRCWNNANNRPFDMGWCEDLIHTVLYGHWVGPYMMPGETVNGETIRISRHGRVLSGQHQGTAAILANEWLAKARAQQGDGPSKYPAWDGQDHVFLETVVVTGLSEDERVLRSIDYVKPRTTADMLYTMPVFRQNTSVERKEMTKMLAVAIDTLWERTDTKGYKTHPEVVGFLERHRRLLKCVEHLFVENGARAGDGGRRITKLRLNHGQAAALCYLMGCGTDATTEYSDDYRNESPPSERNLDWGYWDRALAFWTSLATDRSFIPVRDALGQLFNETVVDGTAQGLGGRTNEKLAILSKAWERYKDHPDQAGPAFLASDCKRGGCLWLTYTNLDDRGRELPNKQIKLVDVADFLGIDCPVAVGQSRPEALGEPMPVPPSRAEIERATEEARARRTARR